jgi:hypothetical protein
MVFLSLSLALAVDPNAIAKTAKHNITEAVRKDFIVSASSDLEFRTTNPGEGARFIPMSMFLGNRQYLASVEKLSPIFSSSVGLGAEKRARTASAFRQHSDSILMTCLGKGLVTQCSGHTKVPVIQFVEYQSHTHSGKADIYFSEEPTVSGSGCFSAGFRGKLSRFANNR